VNACEELDVASHMGTEVKVDLGAHLALRSSAMPSRRVSAKGEILADFPTETPMEEVLEEDDIAALVRHPLAHAMPSNVVNVTGDHHAASAMEMMLEVDIAEALLAHLELAMPFNGVNANAETRAVTHTVETEEIISPATHHLVAVELAMHSSAENVTAETLAAFLTRLEEETTLHDPLECAMRFSVVNASVALRAASHMKPLLRRHIKFSYFESTSWTNLMY